MSTKEVQPTDAGRVLLQLYQIFARLEQAIQVTQRIDRGNMGQLVVGSTSSIAYDILSTILQNFRENFPEVELVLQELTTTQQEQALRDRRIQVGFGYPPFHDSSLSLECILQESLIVQNIQRIGVVYRKLQELTPKVETAVVWRQEDDSSVLREFLKVVRTVSQR